MRGKRNEKSAVTTSDRITPADAGKTRRRTIANTCPEDHPRGCGENAGTASVSYPPPGSPPRMRGKPSNVTAFDGQPRITPADAGKTAICLLMRIRPRDHPRGCGENRRLIALRRLGGGSPPRMRGKLIEIIQNRTLKRITPADAGKTVVFLLYTVVRWDHPRGCGEN